MACKTENATNSKSTKSLKQVFVENAAVVTAHPIATQVGIDILKKGGNAIDAAIAVQFALAVTYPRAGNIGGGGFMIIRLANGEKYCLDFREKAPALSNKDMYLDDAGDAISRLSKDGHLAAGVPGSVDGMVKAFERFSKLKDWKSLVNPSIKLALNGFSVAEKQIKDLESIQNEIAKFSTKKVALGSPLQEGRFLLQKDLGKTLKAISDFGADGFYKGWVAESIVAEMKRGNGIMTLKDLAKYEAIWRDPIVGEYEGFEIVSMPPPSSGGIALLQLFDMLEPYDLHKMKYHSPEMIHLISEVERRVYADRAEHLGDSDFYPVPIAGLLNSAYLVNRMKDFHLGKASESDEIQAGFFEESEETTHYSILDSFGNAVSVTTTINGSYGSKTVVSGAGFLLNNEMDDFSVKPGVPNLYGLIGNEANKIEPHKRMLSSMTPTIATHSDGTQIIVGSPGGSTIITSVLQTILNIVEFDMSAYDAIQAPRFHHQWLPDYIHMEEGGFNEDTRNQLETYGHEIKVRGPIGRVEAIYKKQGKIEGAADERGDDTAGGY